MAQTGRANFSSAWGLREQNRVNRFSMMRESCRATPGKPNIWKTWWLADISITDHTKSLTDTLGSGSTSTNIFIMSE